MNYFAHGFRHVEDPWFVAGTAAPDWVSLLDRRLRFSMASVAEVATGTDSATSSFARGILRHHSDDSAFHASDAFRAVTKDVADLIRPLVPRKRRTRPSIVAHVLVEMLLDSSLAAADPTRLNAYYLALKTLDPCQIELIASGVVSNPLEGLSQIVRRFIDQRFLYDYSVDSKVAQRIDALLHRIRQEAIGTELKPVIPIARSMVNDHRTELLMCSGSVTI